jgi:hypothetical protein
MKDFLKKLIEQATNFIALQLDRLKVANPTIFIVVQSVFGVILYLFLNDTISLPTPEFFLKITGFTLDAFVELFLTMLMATVGSRTTKFVNPSDSEATEEVEQGPDANPTV